MLFVVCITAKLRPPVIPFMPLLLKGLTVYKYLILCVYDGVICVCLDTTFVNEGNETYIDGLVNFEKMVTKLLLYAVIDITYVYLIMYTTQALFIVVTLTV